MGELYLDMPASLTRTNDPIAASNRHAEHDHWSGVWAMSWCVFVLIASEFMPVSLLTPMAAALGVSEGMVGQGIAISGMFAVLSSLSVAKLAGGRSRKNVLLCLTLLMAISGALVAMAPNYPVYLLGRALIGVVVGGFWSMAAATAMRLVRAEQVPRALAIFNGGNALAAVIAAPLGSYLGALVGWRGAFFCLVPAAVLALVWQWRSLPRMQPAASSQGQTRMFKLLASPKIAYGMAACGLFFMGQFALFTYVRPYLERVTFVSEATFSAVLLVVGVCGLIGTSAISAVLKRSLYASLVVSALLMAAIAVLLVLLGSWLAPVVVLLGLWGALATAAPVGWWTWIAQSLPQDAELGGALMVAVIQLAITLGTTAGGWLYDSRGYASTFAASAVLLAIAAGLSAWTACQRP